MKNRHRLQESQILHKKLVRAEDISRTLKPNFCFLQGKIRLNKNLKAYKRIFY